MNLDTVAEITEYATVDILAMMNADVLVGIAKTWAGSLTPQIPASTT